MRIKSVHTYYIAFSLKTVSVIGTLISSFAISLWWVFFSFLVCVKSPASELCTVLLVLDGAVKRGAGTWYFSARYVALCDPGHPGGRQAREDVYLVALIGSWLRCIIIIGAVVQ